MTIVLPISKIEFTLIFYGGITVRSSGGKPREPLPEREAF
jgi:hypothetical protein